MSVLKSKGISDLYSETASTAKDIAEFSITTQEELLTFACECNLAPEFRNEFRFEGKKLVVNYILGMRRRLSASVKPPLKGSQNTKNYQDNNRLKCCERVLYWMDIVFQGDYERDVMKSMYEGILESPTDGLEQSIIQIKRDINRTYPNHPLFKQGSLGFKSLEDLLVAYCKYDR